MNRWIAALDRTLVLIVGIALLGTGAYAIAWYTHVDVVRAWVSRLDRDVVFGLPEQPWWHWVLSGTFAVCLVAGLALLLLNLGRRRTSALTLRHNESDTDVSVDLGPVAEGVATQLADFPGVRDTRGRATVDRGLSTLRVIVTADPGIDVIGFDAHVEHIARSTRRALGGSRFGVQVLLHLDRVEAVD